MESALVLLFASFLFPAAGAVQYEVFNNAVGTPGGARFDSEIGLNYSKQVLADASSFIWTIFNQSSVSDRKPVQLITLIVESSSTVAFTVDNEIHLSANYVAAYVGDVRREVVGVLYHEATHVWQWNGGGSAYGGLIEGIADYVRLKGGYAPAHWVGPGGGEEWDEGYDVTARFLEYCNGLSDGFVARLNAKLRFGYYTNVFFKELLGKIVSQLWSDYKACVWECCEPAAAQFREILSVKILFGPTKYCLDEKIL